MRVSVTGEREPDSLRSPDEQRQRIAEWCEREGYELVATHDEIDVSGGKPLEDRPGLSEAVRAIEAGEADVVIAAYFDRLVRSLRVQGEVVQRIEAAGGGVLALDVGAVSEATAAQWASSTMLGMMSEWYRRSIGERVAAAEEQMVRDGISPHKPPPGYARDKTRRLIPDENAELVREAFAMRARGETIKAIRRFLEERGLERSYHGVQVMLRNRVYLGEVRRGTLVNANAHESLIDPDTWAAVQRMRVLQGRQSRSPLLLARLGVLRCGTCGAVMVAGSQRQRGKRYPMYRCSGDGRECERPVYIAAGIADKTVSEAVRGALAGVEGRASAEQGAREAEDAVTKAQADLDAAIRAFSGLEEEPAARERLAELREVRDAAVEHLRQLGDLSSAVVLRGDTDWDALSFDARRQLIALLVEEAEVRPGRGSERVRVTLRE